MGADRFELIEVTVTGDDSVGCVLGLATPRHEPVSPATLTTLTTLTNVDI